MSRLDRALVEIAIRFPHYSPKQVEWLAMVCADPRRTDIEKLICTVICDASGPELSPVEISDAEIIRRIRAMAREARRKHRHSSPLPEVSVNGLWGRA